MMNGAAVLPAVVTTFAGNAATISAGSVQNGSQQAALPEASPIRSVLW